MGAESDCRPFMVWFAKDELDPIPVRARDRSHAFSIGRRYAGPFGDYRGVSVAAAVDEDGGETFDGVPDDEFVTDADV